MFPFSIYGRFYLGAKFLYENHFSEIPRARFRQSVFTTKHCSTLNVALFNRKVRCSDTHLNKYSRVRSLFKHVDFPNQFPTVFPKGLVTRHCTWLEYLSSVIAF